MAESYGLKTDRMAGSEHYVTSIHNGDWMRMRAVDFGERLQTRIKAAVLNSKDKDAVIEFTVDRLGNKPFAVVQVDNDGIVEAAVANSVSGVHDVYMLFRGGDGELFDFDWWITE